MRHILKITCNSRIFKTTIFKMYIDTGDYKISILKWVKKTNYKKSKIQCINQKYNKLNKLKNDYLRKHV